MEKPVKCIFGDPPDNIGFQYKGYKDELPTHMYYEWLRAVVLESLLKCKVFWLSYNAVHELEVTHIFRDILKFRHPTWTYSKFIWHYTFSQYNDKDCAYGYRPIVRLRALGGTLYPDAIRVPSRRMEMGDPRAAGPRVPDNVWEFPRVVGNAHERVDWMPTQHPIALMDRIQRFSCIEGETFVDLFGGSGSSLKTNCPCDKVVVELDASTCESISALTGVKVQELV